MTIDEYTDEDLLAFFESSDRVWPSESDLAATLGAVIVAQGSFISHAPADADLGRRLRRGCTHDGRGCHSAPDHGMTADAVARAADVALHRSKRNGRDRWTLAT